MNIENMLDQTGALDALQRDLGVDHNTAAAGAAALMPALLKGSEELRQRNPKPAELMAVRGLSV